MFIIYFFKLFTFLAYFILRQNKVNDADIQIMKISSINFVIEYYFVELARRKWKRTLPSYLKKVFESLYI